MRYTRLVDDTVLAIHDEGEALSDAIDRERDYWERNILDYLADKYPQQEIILDIGANVGNHTAYFAQYLEYYNIIAFEPIPDNFLRLRENTRYYPNVFCRNEAVGDERKSVLMYPNRGNMGASEVREDGTIKVNQVRVDDLLLRQKVTLMKIDVEWWEPQVLEGAREIISSDKPIILLEDAKEEYFTKMSELGYHLEIFWPQHKTFLWVPNV